MCKGTFPPETPNILFKICRILLLPQRNKTKPTTVLPSLAQLQLPWCVLSFVLLRILLQGLDVAEKRLSCQEKKNSQPSLTLLVKSVQARRAPHLHLQLRALPM